MPDSSSSSHLIERLDREGAARKIGPGRRSITGRVAIGGDSVPFESSLERDLLVVLAFDRSVQRVRAQPVRIRWRDQRGKARRYTPDFLIEHREAQATLCEVKYRADFWAEWPSSKPRYRAARLFARDAGMRFSILTDVEIRGPYLENVTFLRHYATRHPQEGIEEKLADTLTCLGETSPEALLAAAYACAENRMRAIGPLWRLVATGRIQADLSVALTMQSAIWPRIEEDEP